jgi:Tfp pilus assembly protein PilV
LGGFEYFTSEPHPELVLEWIELGELMSRKINRRKLHPESGMTLIELLIAGFVLVFGMLSIMGLLFIAIGNNGRSKIDSQATMLSQAVLEQLSAKLSGGGPGSLTDNANCNGTGTTHAIGYDAGGASTTGGAMDFTQAQGSIGTDSNGNPYYMDYVDCSNNVPMIYDVRWNIQSLGNATYLVTVGARPKNGLPQRFAFAIPVNMRTYVGGI